MTHVQNPSSSVEEQQMEMQLSCSVCLELFVDPVLLPCLHSLCRRCVEKMTNHGGVISLTFKCPECNNNVELGTNGSMSLKRNFPLSSMVSIYKQTTMRRQKKSVTLPAGYVPSAEKSDYIKVEDSWREGRHVPERAGSKQNNLQPIPAPRRSKIKSNLEKGTGAQSTGPVQQMTVPVSGATGQTWHEPDQINSQSSDQSSERHIAGHPVMDHTLFGTGGITAQGTTQAALQNPPTFCCTCEVGKARMADTFCETCTLSFCGYCLHAYHPDGMEHRLTPLTKPETQAQQQDTDQQSFQCPICDPSSLSPATLRCLECEMIFCDQCLVQCHPSTKTVPGHTLVEIKNSTKRQQSGTATGGSPGAKTTGTGTLERENSRAGVPASRHSGCSIDSLRCSSGVDYGGLVQLTGKFHCSGCVEESSQNAAIKCLDCCSYFCEACVLGHQTDHPSHTLLDIRLDNQDNQEPKPGHVPRAPKPPGKPVNVQLKLVELMGIRAEAMAELLIVLKGRRAELEGL